MTGGWCSGSLRKQTRARHSGWDMLETWHYGREVCVDTAGSTQHRYVTCVDQVLSVDTLS